MIPLTPHAIQDPDDAVAPWRRAMRDAVRDPFELLRLVELPATTIGDAAAARDFPLLAPLGYIARMRRGDPNDPLLLQVLPQAAETVEVPGYITDPVGDLQALSAPGLLHKYHGRALIVATGACAVHCRYCFRRHFPYAESGASHGRLERLIEALRQHPEIDEIILSGGDPLMLDDEKLAAWVKALEELPQLRRLRLHTRMPVILPERVDEALLGWICSTRLQVICVIHCNHANELDHDVGEALNRLRMAGVSLLNQSVLLRDINDTTETLASLSLRLFEFGVLPYYLHLLDPVAGAAHFNIPETHAREIMHNLRASLPGYLVPRLVREEAGKSGKTDIPPLDTGTRLQPESG